MSKIINIVFSESSSATFKYAFKKNIIKADKIIAFYDNLSSGPINNLKDINSRDSFLKELNCDEDVYLEEDELKDNYKKFYNDISDIQGGDTLYLWYGHCDREICGMLYTIYLLKDKNVNVYSINVSDKIIESSEGKNFTYIAGSVGEIFPEKIAEYLLLARKIEKDKYDKLLNRWEKLTQENLLLRSYINGNMESVCEDYFDINILKYTSNEYKKSARTVGDVLGNTQPRITDDFIFWRIKKLVESGKISFKGKFGVMREMEICITNKGLEYLRSDAKAMNLWNDRKKANEEKTAFIKSIKEEGRLEERIEIAKRLLDVLDKETIADKTGLTVGQVMNLNVKS